MEYLVRHPIHGEDRRFSLSYSELREHWATFCGMRDEEFLATLPAAAHLACIISWLKEVPLDATVGDYGIVHRLVHLMTEPQGESLHCLPEIRQQFRDLLRL